MLTQARLKQLLRYDSHSGAFYWRVAFQRVAIGVRAGKPTARYSTIMIDGKKFYVHRLAWLYVHGRFPQGHLDHINRNKTDNRIANLREASKAQNGANSRQRNATGFKGVKRHHRKWAAGITYKGQNIYLGLFSTPQAAHRAYCRAAKKLHKNFFHDGA